MGQFSWMTMDTGEQIGSQDENTITVTMFDDKGNTWVESQDDGYGVFGGKDYYDLTDEMNGYDKSNFKDFTVEKGWGSNDKPDELRTVGIMMSSQIENKHAPKGTYKFPGLMEYYDIEERKDHDFSIEAEDDPNQSWYVDEEGDVFPYAKGGSLDKRRKEYAFVYKIYEEDGYENPDRRDDVEAFGYTNEEDARKEALRKVKKYEADNLKKGEEIELELSTIWDEETGYVLYYNGEDYDIEEKRAFLVDTAELSDGPTYYDEDKGGHVSYAKGGKTEGGRYCVIGYEHYDSEGDLIECFNTEKQAIEEGHRLADKGKYPLIDIDDIDEGEVTYYIKEGEGFYFAKGGETKQTVAVYDMAEFLNSQLDNFIDNPKEFEERADYLLEDEYEREKYEEDKEEYIRNWFYSSDSDSYDWYWDDVKEELAIEFDKYIDDRVFVKGRNMGWRNREGTKTFVLEDTEQMITELVPENTDFTYYLYKIKDGEYEARVGHHDSPMGEYFEIKIEPNYINRIYLENNDGERIGLIYVDSSELGKVEKLEDHEFENFSYWKDEDEDDEGNYVVLQYDFEDTKKNINKNFDEFVKHFPNSTLTEDIKEINY